MERECACALGVSDQGGNVSVCMWRGSVCVGCEQGCACV